ncbi:MAG: hypothetical protein ISR76_09605 [Planctomycetes bacterium]|nr:hypothetical protein [Planctomycetota bacterium]MBL7009242.1 hypothetical protein [Planctomycetota bacterium]
MTGILEDHGHRRRRQATGRDPRRGRVLLQALLLLGCGAGGFLAGSGALAGPDEHERTITDLQEQVGGLKLRLEMLRERQRVALLDQVDQGPSERRPGESRTRFRFRETGPDGATLGEPQRFELEGDVVYLDAQVIKFDDEFVESRDLARGSTLLLFRRVFGEFQAPSDGFLIDTAGARPLAYSAEDGAPAFHEELWRDFWRYANEPEVAQRSGVRAMHGEAPYVKLVPGKSYQVELRSSEGLTIRVVPPPKEDSPPQ